METFINILIFLFFFFFFFFGRGSRHLPPGLRIPGPPRDKQGESFRRRYKVDVPAKDTVTTAAVRSPSPHEIEHLERQNQIRRQRDDEIREMLEALVETDPLIAREPLDQEFSGYGRRQIAAGEVEPNNGNAAVPGRPPQSNS
jgi:hypothetical protein